MKNDVKHIMESVSADLAGTANHAYFEEMKNRYIFLLEQITRRIKSGAVLDVGASPGIFTRIMQMSGYDTVGLDLYPHKRFPAAGAGEDRNIFIENEIKVVSADIVNQPFPFSDSTFDFVTMNETIEHLIGSPMQCISEIKRVLKPGGLLFLSTPNVATLANRLRFASGKNIYTPMETLINVQAYKLHNREYTMADLEYLVAKAGFSVVEKKWLNLGGENVTGLKRTARSVYYLITNINSHWKSNLFLIAKS